MGEKQWEKKQITLNTLLGKTIVNSEYTNNLCRLSPLAKMATDNPECLLYIKSFWE